MSAYQMRRVAAAPQSQINTNMASGGSNAQVIEESASSASGTAQEGISADTPKTYQQLQTVQTVHGYPNIPPNATTAMMYRGRPTASYLQQLEASDPSRH